MRNTPDFLNNRPVDEPAGVAALKALKELEKRLDSDIKSARSEASKIVERARSEAAAVVGEKEIILAGLVKSFSVPPPGSTPGKDVDPVAIDEKLVAEIAGELLKMIVKPGLAIEKN